MIKRIMLLLVSLMLLQGLVSATLMFSEDFESYELNNVTWHSVDNTWFCPDLNNDDCKETDWGVPPATANATQFITQNVYGNQYLLLWSWDANNNGGKKVEVSANITPSGWVASKDWSVQYDILYVWSDWSSISGLPNPQRNGIGGFTFGVFGVYTDGDIPVSAVGGKYNGTSEEDFERLRIKWQGLPFDAEPSNSACDINDGNWHKITLHYNYDSTTLTYNRTDVYVDLSQCMSYTGTRINPAGSGYRRFSVISSDGHLIYLDNIAIYMDELVEPTSPQAGVCNTTCDSWSLPYYMTDSFVGYMYLCDWLTSDNVCQVDEIEVLSNDTNFYAQKSMDLIEEDDIRYATISFNVEIVDMPSIASTFAIRLYDSDDFNFLTYYTSNSSDGFYYDDDGTATFANNFTFGSEKNIKLVVDLQDDLFDVYYDGSKVKSNAGFTDAFVNVIDIETFKVVGSYTGFVLDDLSIYGSDENGNPQMPDEGVLESIPNSSISICGLFYSIDKDCSEGTDCITGQCSAIGKCSKFDFNYCDDNGHKRNTYCMFAGVTSCFLNWVGDLILEKFFLFLIVLLLIMGAVYLKIMWKK